MSDSFDLTGGDALVIGASRGIGLAIARRLIEKPPDGRSPQRLFVTYRGGSVPAVLRELGERASLSVIAVRCELTRDADLRDLQRSLDEREARLVLTLHAAGILHEPGVEPEAV